MKLALSTKHAMIRLIKYGCTALTTATWGPVLCSQVVSGLRKPRVAFVVPLLKSTEHMSSFNLTVKVPCPFCKAKIPSDSLRCRHCAADLSEQKIRGQISSSVKRKRIVILAILAFIALPFFVSRIAGQFSPSSPSSPSTQSAQSVSIGSKGFIRTSSAQVVLTIDEKAFDDFTKAAVANDTVGMGQIVLQERGFFVPNGTNVLAIDASFAKRQVRVL